MMSSCVLLNYSCCLVISANFSDIYSCFFVNSMFFFVNSSFFLSLLYFKLDDLNILLSYSID